MNIETTKLVPGEEILVTLDHDQEQPHIRFMWNLICSCGKMFCHLGRPRKDVRYWHNRSCCQKAVMKRRRKRLKQLRG